MGDKRMLKKKNAKFFAIALCIMFVCTNSVFSAPKKAKSELVKEKEGYYYGYGKASTEQEAIAIAKKELIENALTATLRQKDSKADQIVVSDENVKERLVSIKPSYQNSKVKNNLYFEVSVKDFEKDMKAFDEKLRKTLQPKYEVLTGRGAVASRIEQAVSILDILAKSGETELLTFQANGTELFSRKVEDVCKSILNNLEFSVSTKNGIVGPGTEFFASVKDSSGKGVPNISVKAVWEIPGLAIRTNDEEVESVISVVKTDAEGNAKVDYPVSDSYKNKIVCLTVSTSFSMSETASAEMRMLDAQSSAEGHFVYYENIETAFKSIDVAAGEYKTGAVQHDRRAVPKEKEREVTLEAFSIDLYPVTNLQYAAYLYLTDSDENPEYFDNDDYNLDWQPVVGITVAQAEAYAAWLSEQTGWNYRLPTDDEWEVAARAGSENIYPWGNDDPKKAKAANFKGNGKFKFTSPVDAFMNGANAWGIVDLVGNVWEWTSTSREAEDGGRTVKGGSWMDGPNDLRISNYKNIDSESPHRDVGFRLVKEVTDEK